MHPAELDFAANPAERWPLQYFIPANGGGKLGLLHDHSAVVMDPGCPALLGATLELATVGCAVIERQISEIFSSGRIPEGVSTALFLYLGCPTRPGAERAVEMDTLEKLLDLLARTRLGLEDEMKTGTLEIRQNDPANGTTLRGYVAQNFFTKSMGPIHLAFNRIVQDDLYFSGAFSANLLFHEATHRYLKTVDHYTDPGNPNGKLSGYFNRPQRGKSLLAAYKMATGTPSKKREFVAGAPSNKITPEEALNNADSLSFFLNALLDDNAACLSDALKGQQERARLTAAAQRFEQVQRQFLDKNPIIKQLGVSGQVTFLRVSSGNFST